MRLPSKTAIMSSVYDVAIRIAAETKDLVKEVKSSTNLLSNMAAIAGTVFAAGQIKDAVAEIYNYGSALDTIRSKAGQLTGLQGEALNKLTGDIKATGDMWEQDYNKVLETSNVLMKQMGIDGDESMKLIKQGLASGGDATGDFLQQVSEYAPMFHDAKMEAGAMIAIITQSVKSGVYSDKGADAIKEGMLRMREMTKATREALDGIGLSSSSIEQGLSDGSMQMFDVIKMVSQKLNDLPPQSAKVGTAIADIFGGAGEDAGLAYLQTLKDIELDMDKVTDSSGDLTKQQLAQAEASKALQTEMANLFGGMNEEIREVKLTAMELAVGVVQNFDNITRAVKIGGTALVAYKTYTIAADFSMMKWRRTLVSTRQAIRGVNTAIKANPIGLAIGLLATAGVAYLAYKDSVDDASQSQEGFNTRMSETNTLLDSVLDRIEDSSISKFSDYFDLDKLDSKQLSLFKKEIDGLSKSEIKTVIEQIKDKVGELNREFTTLEEDGFDRVKDNDIFEVQTKALEKYRSMIKIAESELGDFKGDEVSWYQKIEDEIKAVQKEIKEVGVGDTNRLITLNSQLANLEEQKKKLKELGKVPTVKMLKLDLSDEDLDDFDELEIIDEQAPIIVAALKKELKEAAEYNALFGDSHSLLQDQIELTKQSITDLIDNGYGAESKYVKALVSDLDTLQERYKSSNAGFMEWVGNLRQGIGTVQQGISNITSLGSAFDSLHQKEKEGNATALDYISVVLQMASSILGTIQVVDTISKALKAKQVIETVATTTAIGEEAAKATAVVSAEASKSAAVTASQTVQTTAIVTGQSAQTAAVLAAATTQAAAIMILGQVSMGANASRGISAAIASAAMLPFPYNMGAMGVALNTSTGMFVAAKGVAAGLAATPFADGGVVTGPTLGLVGEYPGAANNPELIAPADKMMGYIRKAVGEAGGGVGGTVKIVFANGSLEGYMDHQNRKQRNFR